MGASAGRGPDAHRAHGAGLPADPGHQPARAAPHRQGGGRPLCRARLGDAAGRPATPPQAAGAQIGAASDALPGLAGEVRGGAPPHRLRGAAVRAARRSGATPRLAGRSRGAVWLHRRRRDVSRLAAVRADRGAGARAGRDRLGPAPHAADGATAAGRRRFRQDGGRGRGADRGQRQRLPGRAHGPDRDPGGAALPHPAIAAGPAAGRRTQPARRAADRLDEGALEARDRRGRGEGQGRRRRGHARADSGRRLVPPPRHGGGRRAAPLRRDAARGVEGTSRRENSTETPSPYRANGQAGKRAAPHWPAWFDKLRTNGTKDGADCADCTAVSSTASTRCR